MLNRVLWVIGLFIVTFFILGVGTLLAIRIWGGDCSNYPYWQGCKGGLVEYFSK